MTKKLTVTILGSGCSTGVPRVDGYWGACDPKNPKNRRSRCSAWFALRDNSDATNLTSVVIDTAPDFREQMLAAQVPHVDAVLWTHDHADQMHGIDDIRAFTFARREPIEGYFDQATRDTLFSRFGYIFTGKLGYPPICQGHVIPPHGVQWHISGPAGDLQVVTFDQAHGPIRSVGYRIGDIAYSSDVSDIPEESFLALAGVKLWIVDCLRYQLHPTHSHLEQTLAWIDRIKPERAILTNLHQDMDYAALKNQLPPHIEPAFDQMAIEFSV